MILTFQTITGNRKSTRNVKFQRFSNYDAKKGLLKGRMESKEIDFKRVKIFFVLIWRKFLSPALHWAKRHSKSYCIHVVLILYKTDFLIMTHKHVSNIIISGSPLSFNSLTPIVYVHAYKSRMRDKSHAEMFQLRWFHAVIWVIQIWFIFRYQSNDSDLSSQISKWSFQKVSNAFQSLGYYFLLLGGFQDFIAKHYFQ